MLGTCRRCCAKLTGPARGGRCAWRGTFVALVALVASTSMPAAAAAAVRLLSKDWQVREYKSTSSPSSTWLKVPLATPSFLDSFPPSSFPTCFLSVQRLESLRARTRCCLAVHCRLPLLVPWASDTGTHLRTHTTRGTTMARTGSIQIDTTTIATADGARASNVAIQKREMQGASRCLKTRTADRPF